MAGKGTPASVGYFNKEMLAILKQGEEKKPAKKTTVKKTTVKKSTKK